jgi:hypothetical protein
MEHTGVCPCFVELYFVVIISLPSLFILVWISFVIWYSTFVPLSLRVDVELVLNLCCGEGRSCSALVVQDYSHDNLAETATTYTDNIIYDHDHDNVPRARSITAKKTQELQVADDVGIRVKSGRTHSGAASYKSNPKLMQRE